MNNIVFVVQEPDGQNISPAKEFGEIQVLLLKSDIKRGPAHCCAVLKMKLEKAFEYHEAYLLPIGDPIMIALASAILFDCLSVSKMSFLRWDREHQQYVSETYRTL